MSIIANNNGNNFTPIPSGSYVARCYSMVHIGTVTEQILGEEKTLNKVRITWELPTEQKVFKEENGEQPYSVSKDFTLSMHEKANLRKFLESWRGKGFTDDEAKSFDVTKLLGKPCMISVIHKTNNQNNVYAQISSVSAMPKGLECPPLINPIFEFDYENFDQDKFDSLPDWLKDKMRTSKEYKEIVSPGHYETHNNGNGNNNDDLPF